MLKRTGNRIYFLESGFLGSGIYFQLRCYLIVSCDKGYEYFILLRLCPGMDYYEFTLSLDEFLAEIDVNNASYYIDHR